MDLALQAKLKFVQCFYPEELSGIAFATPEAKDEAGLSAEGEKQT
jgi:hypothetical protein